MRRRQYHRNISQLWLFMYSILLYHSQRSSGIPQIPTKSYHARFVLAQLLILSNDKSPTSHKWWGVSFWKSGDKVPIPTQRNKPDPLTKMTSQYRFQADLLSKHGSTYTRARLKHRSCSTNLSRPAIKQPINKEVTSTPCITRKSSLKGLWKHARQRKRAPEGSIR